MQSYNSTMLQIIYKYNKLYRFSRRDVDYLLLQIRKEYARCRQRTVHRDTTGRYVASVAPRIFPVAKNMPPFIYTEYMLPDSERVPCNNMYWQESM